MVADLVFYMLAIETAVLGVLVVSARNPVHSVLFLVATFFAAAGLFVLLQAEFLAAILVMVYMGAVAVLFLFVVMLLDVDFAELRAGLVKHLPLGFFVGLMILAEMILVVTSLHTHGHPAPIQGDPTKALGMVLYTTYLYPFELASLVLLVALVGAIVLTLRARTGAKKQNVSEQLARRREDAVELKTVASGEGA
ncbi:MAG: NADH-quinone oxidoreductase subunit J [Magnetococcales bacterium]|nr:NADH-quinone oxidoreductase subunit J [Magnetococcales bacterium]NGZ26439.1 NADH-quinone oxidoreductase subunit J [Magnetococcales bacterium]